MGLAEEFKADLETKEQSKQFQLEEDFRAFLRDRQQGGSIRQAPVGEAGRENFPIGAVVGGVGGAIAGQAVAPFAPGAAAIVGAGGGAAIGQFVQGRVERAIGDKLAPVDDTAEQYRIAREAATALGTESLGQSAGFLLPKIRALAPFAPSVTPQAREAMKFVEQHGGSSTSLLPAEMTSSRLLDIVQNISQHSILGEGAIDLFKTDRDAFNAELARSIIGRYGPAMNADEIGRAVVDATRYNLEAAKVPADFIYGALESAAAPQYAKAVQRLTVKKDVTPTRETRATTSVGKAGPDDISDPQGLVLKTTFQDVQVGDTLRRMKVTMTEQETQIGGTRIDLRTLKDDLAGMSKVSRQAGGLEDTAMGHRLLKFIDDKPDLVSYPVAKAMRTEIRAYRDQLMLSPETKNAPGIGKANTIYTKLTDQIRKGLADDDPFLAVMWDEANLIEAGANQQFNTKIIRELVQLAEVRGANAPEAIVEKVWRPRFPTRVKEVRNAVPPEAWRKMQQIEMDKLMAQSFDGNIPNGDRMQAVLFGPAGIGTDVLEAGFDRATVTELKEFVKTLQVQQQKSPDKIGSVWIQLSQATAAFQAIGAGAAAVGLTSDKFGGAGLTATGAFILLAPPVAARIMTSPNGIRWLTEGLTTSMKTKRGIHIATQLAKVLEGEVPRRTEPSPSSLAAPPSTQLPISPLQQ